jgi:urease accessory protein
MIPARRTDSAFRPHDRDQECSVTVETADGVLHVPLPSAAGTGFVRFVRSGARTVVSRAYATSPLRLLTPRNHGAGAWVYVASHGGGLVDGDALRLDVGVGSGALALLSTQASTKVYRSPAGTSMDLRAAVDSGGTLVVLPDPVVCFAGATYRQAQCFDLAAGANAIVLEWLTSGRRAAGERWAFDAYRARTTIRRDGRLAVHDALSLCAADGDLPSRLGRFDVIAALMFVGPGLRDRAHRALRAVGQTPIEPRAGVLMSASAIGDDGALVRIAGLSVERVGGVVREVLSFIPAVLGDDPWARRP